MDVEFGMIKFQITAQFPESRLDVPFLSLANVHLASIFSSFNRLFSLLNLGVSKHRAGRKQETGWAKLRNGDLRNLHSSPRDGKR